MRNIPHLWLRGDVDTRIATVEGILARYRKYQNLLDLCM
jgi:hypothetical protein